MSSPRLSCVCGKDYATEKSLKQHQRYYCKGVPPSAITNNCPVCDASFQTYAGMRQHLKKRHPNEYNAELQVEAGNRRTNWTMDEEDELAKAEAGLSEQLPITTIIEHLMSLSSRSRESIKARRKLSRYKNKVSHYRQELMASRPEPESTSSNEQINSLNDHLREAIVNIPDENLDTTSIRVKNLLIHGQRDEAAEALNSWYESLILTYQSRLNEGRRNPSRDKILEDLRGGNLTSRRRRILLYKLHQMEIKKDPKGYAAKLLEGKDLVGEEVTPSADDITEHYNNIFCAISPQDNERVEINGNLTETSYPVSEEELLNTIKTSKSDSPGPDGVTLRKVATIPSDLLLLLFNGIILLESIPTAMKKSRTILLPKTIKERACIKNWRPITIGATLLRLLNKILANRLAISLDMHGSQRGFTRIDGCFINCLTIESLIKHHRKKGLPLTLLALDLSKAFDRLSHNSILRAMKRFNMDGKSIKLIMDNFKNTTTTIKCNTNTIGDFNITRGVKQGDPLSPILFNMVLDELLVELHKKSGVPIGDNSKVCSLAYADDIVIFAKTPEDAERMLALCIDFLNKRGLKLNPSKCVSLVMKTVPAKKKLVVISEPAFKVDEECIPSIGINDAFKYLGHKFNSEGITPCSAEGLYNQLTYIKKAPLKPQQKMAILRTHLIPRYIYSLQRPNITKGLLKDVDKKIRMTVKQILHLHSHCANSIFYAQIKSGGLGLFCFEKSIPIISLNRINKLTNISEDIDDTIKLGEKIINNLRRLIGNQHTTKDEIKKHFADSLQASFSGNGLHQVGHRKECSQYIKNPPAFWTGEEYIKAHHLRFNLLPCMGIPSNPREMRYCRRGCRKTESVCHILQRCPETHTQRIRRHDIIVHRIADFAVRKGWQVRVEPYIRGRDGLLKKPDIIMHKGHEVIVTDVGVNWEGPIPLRDQYFNKQAIYSTPAVVEKLKDEYPDKNLYILPFIMGARGAWCENNKGLVHRIGLTSGAIREIVHSTLRGGWITHRKFMSSVWRESN